MQQGTTGGNFARQAAHPRRPAGDRRRHDHRSPMRLGPAGDRGRGARIMHDGVTSPLAGGAESISLVQNEHANSFRDRDEAILASKPELYMPMIDTAEFVAERYKHLARGAGRLRRSRASSAPPRRSKAGASTQEIVAGRDRDGRDRQGDGRDAQGEGHARQGRGQPPRHHARRACRAQARARRGQDDHGRQCQPALRRRVGRRSDGREARREAGPCTARRLPGLRRRRAASPTRWASARSSPCRACSSATG